MTSPAGEQVEIFTDEEWKQLTDSDDRAMRMWGPLGTNFKALMIAALWVHGEFTSKSGKAGSDVTQWVQDNLKHTKPIAPTNVSSLMNTPANRPMLARNIRGKRTFSIRLVALPELWFQKLQRDLPQLVRNPAPQEAPQEAPTAAEPQPDEQVAPVDDWTILPVDVDPPTLELQIANQVAISLLTTVVEIISAKGVQHLTGTQRIAEELQHAREQVAERLADNQRLRSRLREAQDQIVALSHERDGLRTRLRMTEHNLTEALKGETSRVVNHEVQKRIDQIMRTTPGTTKGQD